MSNLTLSDLIRKGGSYRPQTYNVLKKGDAVCALGAAYEAAKDEGLIKDEQKEG
jgi:hypothetical protein